MNDEAKRLVKEVTEHFDLPEADKKYLEINMEIAYRIGYRQAMLKAIEINKK